jgi:hypothetical protein
MNPAQLAAETLAAFKAAQATPSALLKSTFSQPTSATSGINYYDLETGAKMIYPVLTPLRNEIPRVSGKGGIQANWRAITAINPQAVSAGVSGGNRGAVIAVSTADYIAAYRGLGLESNVDFEADYAAEGFDDAKALATRVLLESLMIQEEITILGGDGAAVALGTAPTPTLAGSTTGGSLAAQTWSVIVYALTLEGFLNASVSGGILGQITRVNADGSQDIFGGGSSARSAAATVTTTGTTSSIAGSVTVVNGALGYAWFWGASGSETLGAITSINSVLITAAATGTQLSSAVTNGASDNSLNALKFDGLLYQAFKSGSNAYIQSQATGTAGTGTPLTPDGEGGVVEIENALKHFWDVYRLSPTKIYISSQEQKNINKCILLGNQTSAQRFVFNVDQAKIAGGTMVRSYLNKYSMNGAIEIPLEIHPNMPPGTILFFTNKLPYPLSNVGNVNQIRTRREYYQIEWPLRSRRYEYGVYCDEVLQCYAPFSLGVITNIAPGVGTVNSNA